MTDDNEGLENANPEVEEEEPEPLSEAAAALYMDILLKTAVTLRSEGALASDAIRHAEKALRVKFPRAPKLSDKTLAKLGLVVMKVKKPATDPKTKAALLKPAVVKAASLEDMIKAVTGP